MIDNHPVEFSQPIVGINSLASGTTAGLEMVEEIFAWSYWKAAHCLSLSLLCDLHTKLVSISY